MTDVQIESGTLYADLDARTISGLLVPFGEEGNTNLGRFTVEAGTFTLPRDPSVVTLNVDHDREQPIGRATELREEADGIHGVFAFADTDEADATLLAVHDGSKSRLSVEAKGLVIRAGKALAGHIFGAAVVARGAFPSATLMASDAGDLTDADIADLTAITRAVNALPEAMRAALAQALTPTAEETPVSEETPTPEDPAEEEEDTVSDTVSTTLTATAASAPDASYESVLSLITRAKSSPGDETLLAALADVKFNHATAGQNLAAPGVLQPNWLGQLWQGRSYVRKYTSLIRNGDIRSIDEKGFVLDQGSALVQAWAGNKVELPTGTASTSLRSATLQKWGYAADIAREFFDLPGGEEVIDAFLRGVIESYAVATDNWTLAQLVAGVGSTQAAATYPSGYSAVFGQLIQGAEAIEDANDSPSFAILNQKAWDEYKYAPKDQVPEFISFAFGIGQDASGATVPRIVKGNTGIVNTPSVIVGSANAAHFNEKAGSPIQLDALDIARGGIDKAVIGYSQFMVDRPASLIRIGTADA